MSRSIEPIFELYIFETKRLLEQLERCIRDGKQTEIFDSNTINDAFRIIHTIKGSAAMMLYTSISTVAHSLLELFSYLREQKKEIHNYYQIADIVFIISNYIKGELDKIEDNIEPTGNPEQFIIEVKAIIKGMKSNQELKSTINAKKIDKLMNLMDEMVTVQTMVVENPDLNGLKLDNFYKAARQMQKKSNELKEVVISIQMAISADYIN